MGGRGVNTEAVTAMLDLRHRINTSGPGSLLARANKSVAPFAPFDDPDHVHADTLFRDVTWYRFMTAYAAESLWDPDPFRPSPYRPKGLGVWDSAVGIPACAVRNGGVRVPDKVPAVRNANTYWMNDVVPHLAEARKDDAAIVPGVVDLRSMRNGWAYLRAAHVLAHRRAVHCELEGVKLDYGRTSSLLRYSLAEVMFGVLYNMPINVTPTHPRIDGGPNAQYGIRIEPTSRITFPMLRVNMYDKLAPEPDVHTAYILCAMHTSPNPYLFREVGFQAKAHHAWHGLPSLVTFVGWEGVDTVVHQAIGQADAAQPEPTRPLEYVMSSDDLMPGNTIRPLLELAARRLGPPKSEYPWVHVNEWLSSKDFATASDNTPPFPCAECAYYPHTAADAPRKPFGDPDDPKSAGEWADFADDLKALMRITGPAAAMDAKMLRVPSATAARVRREWSANYRKLLRADKFMEQLLRVIRNRRRGNSLSPSARAIYTEALNLYGEAYVEDLSDAQ